MQIVLYIYIYLTKSKLKTTFDNWSFQDSWEEDKNIS